MFQEFSPGAGEETVPQRDPIKKKILFHMKKNFWYFSPKMTPSPLALAWDQSFIVCRVLMPWEPSQRHLLKICSPAGHGMEMKPEARVTCQVMLAVLFTALFITATVFAGECQSFSLTGNVSEIFLVAAFVADLLPCSWGRQSSPKLLLPLGEGCFRAVFLQKTKPVPLVWELMPSRNPYKINRKGHFMSKITQVLFLEKKGPGDVSMNPTKSKSLEE